MKTIPHMRIILPILISTITQIYCNNENGGNFYLTENWTSCEEFLRNTTFDIKSVIEEDWKIFFVWNFENEAPYHVRFSPAAPVLVERFQVELQQYDTSVNWSKAVLFMETSIDFSALYLTTDVPGKFRIVPSMAFQMEYIPELIFAMKVVEPGYLGIMSCKNRLCYALAPVNKMPSEKDMVSAAEKIGFVGDRNYSFVAGYGKQYPVSPYQEDDADDDEQIEIDNNVVYHV